jgi:predicted nuclease of predicted toxin-antitoxin system
VKLLLDQNLSFRLIAVLSRFFPGSQHVRYASLDRATDREVWDYARSNGFAILSKDGDFHQLSLLLGAPPKVIWLQVGNASTSEISNLVREKSPAIASFLKNPDGSLLVIA